MSTEIASYLIVGMAFTLLIVDVIVVSQSEWWTHWHPPF